MGTVLLLLGVAILAVSLVSNRAFVRMLKTQPSSIAGWVSRCVANIILLEFLLLEQALLQGEVPKAGPVRHQPGTR